MHEIFERTTVIPVLTIERLEDALPLASALVRGGLSVLEVTFRTEAAAPACAIAAIARDLPDAVVGAGTLVRPNDITQAIEAGAKFLVSPGLVPELVATGLAVSDVPYLPGVATASEVMTARGLGCSLLKFFPAAAMGGPATLAAFAPVFHGVAFCPTGGVTEENAPELFAAARMCPWSVAAGWCPPRPSPIATGAGLRASRRAPRASSAAEPAAEFVDIVRRKSAGGAGGDHGLQVARDGAAGRRDGVDRDIDQRGLAGDLDDVAAEQPAVDILEVVERALAGGRERPEHADHPRTRARQDGRIAAARHDEAPARKDGRADLASGGTPARHVGRDDIGAVGEVSATRIGRHGRAQ